MDEWIFGCSARIIYLMPGRLQGLCLADIKRCRSGERKIYILGSGPDVPMIVSANARLAYAIGGYGIRQWFYSPTIAAISTSCKIEIGSFGTLRPLS